MGWSCLTRPTEDKSNVVPFITHCQAWIPGKDRGRREQEQGSRGEAGWGVQAGKGLGGIQQEVRKGK